VYRVVKSDVFMGLLISPYFVGRSAHQRSAGSLDSRTRSLYLQDPLDVVSQLSSEEIAIRYAYILLPSSPDSKVAQRHGTGLLSSAYFSHPYLGTAA